MAGEPARRSRRETVEHNRRRLLSAAEELFAEQGQSVTLNDIAHRAGVGVGTAYRRFANKGELIDALFVERLEEAVAMAAECLEDPDPRHGLVAYIERAAQLEADGRGVGQMVSSLRISPSQHRVDAWQEELGPLVDQLVERAKKHGAVRADITTADIVILRAAIASIIDMTRGTVPDVYRRYLTVILDGLRAEPGPPTPLPALPPSLAQSHSGMASVRWNPDKS